MAFRTIDQQRSVRDRRIRRRKVQLAVKIAVSGFILWHLFAVAIWNLPYTEPLITSAMPIVRPYMVGSGFMQGWGMFAPDPYSLDVYVEARVHYADGSVRSWEFPRMAKMSYWERYQKERWRKYIEVAHQDEYSFLWPVMGRYAARVNDIYPNNPPVTVDLIRHFRFVRAPGQPPGDFTAYQFSTVNIKPEDLH